MVSEFFSFMAMSLIFNEISPIKECEKMAKIEMKISVSMEETFEDFLLMKKSMGLSDKTLITYKQHFSAIKKHLTVEKTIETMERQG